MMRADGMDGRHVSPVVSGQLPGVGGTRSEQIHLPSEGKAALPGVTFSSDPNIEVPQRPVHWCTGLVGDQRNSMMNKDNKASESIVERNGRDHCLSASDAMPAPLTKPVIVSIERILPSVDAKGRLASSAAPTEVLAGSVGGRLATRLSASQDSSTARPAPSADATGGRLASPGETVGGLDQSLPNSYAAAVAGRLARPTYRNVSTRRHAASSYNEEVMELNVSSADAEDTDNLSVASTTSGPWPKRRKRGRPPTTGEYVGLAAAKRAVLDAEREELELRERRERLDDAKMAASIPLPSIEELTAEFSQQPTADLCARAYENADTIDKIATTSNRLKGTYVRTMRIMSREFRVLNAQFAQRSVAQSGPVNLLQEENRQLKSRLKGLEDEMVELRRQVATSSRSSPPPAGTRLPATRTARRNRRVVTSSDEEEDYGDTARWLPPTLPPTSSLPTCPPIVAPVATALPAEDLLCKVGELIEAKLREHGIGSSRKQSLDVAAPPNRPRSLAPAMTSTSRNPPAHQGEWRTVDRRMKKKPQPQRKSAQKAGGQRAAVAAPAPAKVGRSAPQTEAKTKKVAAEPRISAKASQGQKKKAAIPARPPRTAAVTLTVGPEGPSYAEALRRVRNSIDLKEFGIKDGIRTRKGVTGAIIMEVPGKEGRERAAILAARMEAALKGTGARVAQPIKRAEIRVSGLDDSVTIEEVAAAVSDRGGCALSEVQTAAIRQSPRGLGTAWVRCTAAAARKLALAGSIVVGWCRARVTYLAARPLQCHRCLELGHVKAKCPNQVDRSGVCYRCGVAGHRAGTCEAPLRCVLCVEAGRRADHRIGGESCPSKGGKKMAAKAVNKGRTNAVSASKDVATAGSLPKSPNKGPGRVKRTAEAAPMEVDMGAAAGPSTFTEKVEKRLQDLTIKVPPLPVKGPKKLGVAPAGIRAHEWP